MKMIKYSIRLLLMLLFAVFIFVPFLWMISSSFKPSEQIFANTMPFSLKTFLPVPFDLSAYSGLLSEGFLQSVIFTIFVGLITVLGGVIVSSMAGFVFAKFQFPGKKILFMIVIITFLIPFSAIAIPLYITTASLGLLNTIYALLLPAIPNGLCVFLFRQFFRGVPSELMEAALIDGAGWWRIYWQIFLPLSKPAIISASLLLFLSQWQSFMWPLLAVQSPKLTMVQVALVSMTASEHTFSLTARMAGASLTAVIPLLMIFPFQKYFVRGISTSGLKG